MDATVELDRGYRKIVHFEAIRCSTINLSLLAPILFLGGIVVCAELYKKLAESTTHGRECHGLSALSY